MNRIKVLSALVVMAAACICTAAMMSGSARAGETAGSSEHFAVHKSEDEWKKLLTPEQYHVMREKGTERAFSGKYDHFFQPGVYRCAACGAELFRSDTKYDPGEGWPSFWAPSAPKNVLARPDDSYFMHRTEVLCSRCGAHLGHVFDDGPKPTGQRYCINSAALKFEGSRK